MMEILWLWYVSIALIIALICGVHFAVQALKHKEAHTNLDVTFRYSLMWPLILCFMIGMWGYFSIANTSFILIKKEKSND